MLMNNLDPDVAEKPDELIVYGGTGKAARDWRSFEGSFVRCASSEAMMKRCSFSRENR